MKTTIKWNAELFGVETVKWNAELFGVEIESELAHFVVSGQPSMAMSWHDAVRFYKDHKVWQLPTREHLKLIAEYIDDVNALIKANGGYEIRAWHWTADEYDEFCAWLVSMSGGSTSRSTKNFYGYVRAVSAF
uniref:hypothetical protein n=1 Tax=Alistipes sp. TaxID=1872444 RepID=UPI004055F9A2